MVLAGLGPIGAPELIIILLVVVLLFGAGKLSTLGRDLGQGIREFKKATSDPEAEAKQREADRQRAQEAGRYVSTANGASEYRPADSSPVAPPPQPAAPVRPPDFTGR